MKIHPVRCLGHGEHSQQPGKTQKRREDGEMAFLRKMNEKLHSTTTGRQRVLLFGISLSYIAAILGSISLFMGQTYLRY